MKQNNKEIIEPIIEIEGINIRDLSTEAIDFYFKCSKKQINILREYLEKYYQSKEKEMLDVIERCKVISYPLNQDLISKQELKQKLKGG